MLNKIVKFYDKLIRCILAICMAAMTLLIAIVLFNVISRYAFSYANVALSELEWHLFAIIFLLGMSCALYNDDHVRVDIFYAGLTIRKKAIINIACLLLFVLPLSFLVSQLSLEYVMEAFASNEASPDPGGLSHRWIIKALIPFSFYLLAFVSIGVVAKNLIIIKDQSSKNGGKK